MEKELTADEYLKGLNDHSVIFELSIEPEYSETQLLLFAEMYHKKAQQESKIIEGMKIDENQEQKYPMKADGICLCGEGYESCDCSLADKREREGIDEAIVRLNDKLTIRYAKGGDLYDGDLMEEVEKEAAKLYPAVQLQSMSYPHVYSSEERAFTQGAKYYKELTEKKLK